MSPWKDQPGSGTGGRGSSKIYVCVRQVSDISHDKFTNVYCDCNFLTFLTTWCNVLETRETQLSGCVVKWTYSWWWRDRAEPGFQWCLSHMCTYQLCLERNSWCGELVRCGWDLSAGKVCLASLLRSVSHWRSASSGFLMQNTPLWSWSRREQREFRQSFDELDHWCLLQVAEWLCVWRNRGGRRKEGG